ncbi:hypothetical protein HDV02_005946 [Globomyces sp. JEL0801]|nr:hypothetical protein HDV02_005946 [Globomyces sp. JEL0801]
MIFPVFLFAISAVQAVPSYYGTANANIVAPTAVVQKCASAYQTAPAAIAPIAAPYGSVSPKTNAYPTGSANLASAEIPTTPVGLYGPDAAPIVAPTKESYTESLPLPHKKCATKSYEQNLAAIVPTPGYGDKNLAATVPTPAYGDKSLAAIVPTPAYGDKNLAAIVPTPAYGDKNLAAIVPTPAYGDNNLAAIVPTPAYGEQKLPEVLPTLAYGDKNLAVQILPTPPAKCPVGYGNAAAQATTTAAALAYGTPNPIAYGSESAPTGVISGPYGSY